MKAEKENVYDVKEIFYSLQGEGRNTGLPMTFIRFCKCNLACAFCDTDFSVSPNSSMTLGDIKQEIGRYKCRNVCLTGGEPLLSINDALLLMLHKAGYFIHIETNGTFPPPSPTHYPFIKLVTISPKSSDISAMLGYSPLFTLTELKVVFDIFNPELEEIIKRWGKLSFTNYFIQPCAYKRTEVSQEALGKAVEFVKDPVKNPVGKWKLGLQIHKILQIR